MKAMQPHSRPHGLAKYQHVAGVLRDRIRSGEYEPGARLPTEPQLEEEFPAYDRSTIRRGLALLRQEGLVNSEQGRGVFVRQTRLLRHPLLDVLRAEYLRDQAGDSADRGLFELGTDAPDEHTEVFIDYTQVPANADLAEQFGIASGTDLLCRKYTFVVDKAVHQITRSYILWSMAENTTLASQDNERQGRGTFTQLAEINVVVDSVSVDLSARMPAPDEAAALNSDEGIPVLIDRRRCLADGTVVCVADTLTPADRIMYGVDLDMAG